MAGNLRKKHGTKREREWLGHAFFSGGFRPFFLTSALFSIIAIGLWLGDLLAYISLDTALTSVDWHRHEMLFGYSSGVIAGFLFTAVPNWTGRLPVVGWPLIWIYALWLAGRFAMLFGAAVPYGFVALIDAAFLPVLAVVIGREIISGKNWRNMKVLIPVCIFGLANIWFHIQMIMDATGVAPIRLGFGAVLALLMIVGGRIIPSFTRNWLAKQEPGKLPVAFNKYDNILERASIVILVFWAFWDYIPQSFQMLVGVIFAGLGAAHVVRIWRWAGHRTFKNPLLAVLHIFYAFVPAGFFVLSTGMVFDNLAIIIGGLHVFGIGGVGGLTMAVMMRASLGHTGRKLATDQIMNVAMIAVFLSVSLRVIGAIWPQFDWAIVASGTCWIIGFGIFCMRIGPWLLLPRLSR